MYASLEKTKVVYSPLEKTKVVYSPIRKTKLLFVSSGKYVYVMLSGAVRNISI